MSSRSKQSSPHKRPPGKQLDQLSTQQQEQVFTHCDAIELCDGVAWLKTEFDITLTEAGLQMWLREERLRPGMQPRLDKIGEARDGARLISKVLGCAGEITEANVVMLAQAAFEEFLKKPEERDSKLLAEYMVLALRARDLDLKGSANRLAREKHYYDLARKSLAYVEKLKSINDSAGDERAKVNRAIVLLFGERPDITDFRDAALAVPEGEGGAQ